MKIYRVPLVWAETAIVHVFRLLFLAVAAALYVYFLPSLIAEKRNRPKMEPIFILNLVAGWLLVPWLVALVLAYKMDGRSESTA